MTLAQPATAPAIYRLHIERFRGIEKLTWWPRRGVNLVLGGGDVCKTTILDAITLLLSPVNSTALADADYYLRDIESGFVITAVMSLASVEALHGQRNASWPWCWEGKDAVVPNVEDGDDVGGEPVFCLQVRGTAEQELIYEVLQPDGTADPLSTALRRAIGLVRLSGDDRNDRDLRLVQGSALDRLVSDKSLRARMSTELAKTEVGSKLTEAAQETLKKLDTAFGEKRLPTGLDLAVTGGQGLSVASLIGLTAARNGVQLPLASWGAGTRRLSALAIAEQNQGETPITVVDEVERGLEPYRQRILMEKLLTGSSQVFVTTHSPAALSASASAAIWHLNPAGTIGPVDSAKTARHRATDPEAFLARLTAVAEGATEAGFTGRVLERTFGCKPIQHGVHVSDGGGHENALGLLEALSDGGLKFAGFVDDEGKYAGRWSKLHGKLGALLFRWQQGCIEENVIGMIPEAQLEALITHSNGEVTIRRLRTLADRLGVDDKDFGSLRTKAGDQFKTLIIAAATGTVPPGKEAEKGLYKSHGACWFKSVNGGRELADKAFNLGAGPSLKPLLLPFCNAVLAAVGCAVVTDI